MVVGRDLAPRLPATARQFPAVTLTGPRQSGKSTLCRAVFSKTLVESKSAQTAGPSLVAGARRVRRHLDDPARPCEAMVVYGGGELQRRSDAKLVPWPRLHDQTWV